MFAFHTTVTRLSMYVYDYTRAINMEKGNGLDNGLLHAKIKWHLCESFPSLVSNNINNVLEMQKQHSGKVVPTCM